MTPKKVQDDQLSQINEENEDLSQENKASRANLLLPSASLEKIDENAVQEEVVEDKDEDFE